MLGVEPNQIGRPFTIVTILQQGGIRSHLHQIAVTLHTANKCRFRQGCPHISTAHSSVTRIFTDVNRVLPPFVMIKQIRIPEKELRCHIIMRIHHIGFRNAHRSVSFGHFVINQSKLRVLLLDGLIKHIETAVIFVSPIFITYLNILQRERCRMSIGCTTCSPFRQRIPQRVFYRIQTVIYIIRYITFFRSFPHTELATQTHITDIHGLGTDVLTKLQHFIIAETIRATIPPCAVFPGARRRIAQSFLPLETVIQSNAFHHTTTGPTEKGGLQTGHHFRHILT